MNKNDLSALFTQTEMTNEDLSSKSGPTCSDISVPATKIGVIMWQTKVTTTQKIVVSHTKKNKPVSSF